MLNPKSTNDRGKLSSDEVQVVSKRVCCLAKGSSGLHNIAVSMSSRPSSNGVRDFCRQSW
jgi:hypothetical protein